MGVSFLLKGMDGLTVNHFGQKLIQMITKDQHRKGIRENFSSLEGKVHLARCVVLFTIWTISMGVDVDLGGVFATGTQEWR